MRLGIIHHCSICGSSFKPWKKRAGLPQQETCSINCRGLKRAREAESRAASQGSQKACEQCGALMRRCRPRPGRPFLSVAAFCKQKYCSRSCGAKATASCRSKKGLRKERWKTDDKGLSWETYRARARLIMKEAGIKRQCDQCLTANSRTNALDVHHVDHDATNNSIDNLKFLCHRCHIKHHWKEWREHLNSNKECCLDGCIKTREGRYAFCSIHLRRWKTYGNPLIVFGTGTKPRQLAGPPANPKYVRKDILFPYWEENRHDVKNLSYNDIKIKKENPE